MELWITLCSFVNDLRPAFSRSITFHWFFVVLTGIIARKDMHGVTSIIRALGLKPLYYDRLLDFFHSSSVNHLQLAQLWLKLIITVLGPLLMKYKNRYIILGDGIKGPKSGRKMPAVKKLFQQSESNTKPQYIFGHSCQSIAIVGMSMVNDFFAIPLVCRIHEGLVFSNRTKLTLLDKMMLMIKEVVCQYPHYFIADAYYASKGVLNHIGKNHLITRVRSNAIGYRDPKVSTVKKRGRKAIFGEKVALNTLFKDTDFISVESPVYDEKNVTIRYKCIDLIWRQAVRKVRFVLVIHPKRGSIILMTTDMELEAVDIIKLYGLRFKIEVSYKQAINTIGTFTYHFWMSEMTNRKNKSGDQYLHKKSERYRKQVKRKMRAYECFLLTGCIAQGLLQILSLKYSKIIWKNFGSWLRTMHVDRAPSELVVSTAMKNSLPEFLKGSLKNNSLINFILSKIDRDRKEGLQMAA